LTIISYSFWTFTIAHRIIKVIKNKLNKK
jgi:hypothetical protein